MSLVLMPVTLREACAFIEEHHRHHDPPRGCLFCVGVAENDHVVGVAVIGRPVARMLQDGWTVIGEAGGGSWDRKDRPRVDTHPTQAKLRWEKSA